MKKDKRLKRIERDLEELSVVSVIGTVVACFNFIVLILMFAMLVGNCQ